MESQCCIFRPKCCGYRTFFCTTVQTAALTSQHIQKQPFITVENRKQPIIQEYDDPVMRKLTELLIFIASVKAKSMGILSQSTNIYLTCF